MLYILNRCYCAVWYLLFKNSFYFSGANKTDDTPIFFYSLLIPHVNLNIPGREGNTPLHIACVRRNPLMIQALLEAGADRTQINSHGETPVDMLKKRDPVAHEFLEGITYAYLLEERASIEECEVLFKS